MISEEMELISSLKFGEYYKRNLPMFPYTNSFLLHYALSSILITDLRETFVSLFVFISIFSNSSD